LPFVSNQGVKIYYEVEGQGSPIVLGHGATGNMGFWRGYGYVDQLVDKYIVILFDARGHGQSDKPHEVEAYNYRLMVRDVISVMDALDIARTHYWGYSMGGYIGFGLAKHYPERLISLIAGGSAPFEPPDESDEPSPILEIFRRGVVDGVDSLVEGMRAWAGTITPQYEARLRSLDLEAMVAYLENAPNRPGFGDDLPHMKMPCLVYAGDADEDAYEYGRKAAQQRPNVRFYSLSCLNHVGASAAAEQIVPPVLSFLADVAPKQLVPKE
jgi:pimeloyl-ACP methyl ester carboxylesterase